MLIIPMDVLQQFPVRKTKKQKQAFREAVQSYASELGYDTSVEEGKMGCRNIIIGDPEKAKYLVTTNYDTGCWYPLPDYIMPCNPVLAILWQVAVIGAYTLLVGLVLAAALACICATMGISLLKALFTGLIFSPVLGVLVGLVLIPAILILFTCKRHNANCNTSGVVTLLEILRTLPDNQRNKVCFVLFDLSELGCIGAASYKKVHQATAGQMVVNLSCVGDGDHMLLMPNGNLKKDKKKYKQLFKCCGYFGKKSLLVQEKGVSLFYTDYKLFPYGVGISAFHKNKRGNYGNYIRIRQDLTIDQTNVNILRAAITTMISSDAAQ